MAARGERDWRLRRRDPGHGRGQQAVLPDLRPAGSACVQVQMPYGTESHPVLCSAGVMNCVQMSRSERPFLDISEPGE